MDLGLKGKTVLVTGSSSGIGRATAIAFGREGARVAVTYRENRAGAEGTVKQVVEAGGEALIVYFDLADRDSIRASIEAIGNAWDSLDVLINNAVSKVLPAAGQPFESVPFERWETALRNNLEGVVATIQCALPLMRKSEWGRIVNISSDAVDGWPGLGPYATSKAGLHGLTRTLATELGPANILCNVVMPGFILTETNQQRVPSEQQQQIKANTPTRQLVAPEDVAAAILFLGSGANKQITGETLRVTGGR